MVSNCHYNIQSRVEPSWMVKCEWLSSPTIHSKQTNPEVFGSSPAKICFDRMSFNWFNQKWQNLSDLRVLHWIRPRRFFEPSWLSSLAEKSPRVPRPGIINQRLFESDRSCSVTEKLNFGTNAEETEPEFFDKWKTSLDRFNHFLGLRHSDLSYFQNKKIA